MTSDRSTSRDKPVHQLDLVHRRSVPSPTTLAAAIAAVQPPAKIDSRRRRRLDRHRSGDPSSSRSGRGASAGAAPPFAGRRPGGGTGRRGEGRCPRSTSTRRAPRRVRSPAGCHRGAGRSRSPRRCSPGTKREARDRSRSHAPRTAARLRLPRRRSKSSGGDDDFPVRGAARSWARERLQLVDRLARDGQRLAARGDDPQARSSGEQPSG